jgi:Tn3 transposase DDE domain
LLSTLITKYPKIRCFAGAFLEVFEFRGGGAVSNLLKALALISEMYRAGKRTLPLKPPTAFIRRAWRPFVFKDGDIDRRAYELCVFSELRNRLRAGDVWVDRSRQYQEFETYLIPKLTFEILKVEGPLPVEIETEVQSYLESRRSALTQELTTVATLAESGKLPDVDLAEGDLKITPLRAVTPPEAESLRDAAYDLLPRIKITALLLEVDRWTGFSECFTHQRNGQPAENKAALLTTILADGINLGLSRMAEACRGATLRQLAWVHDWHIREETYAAALSQLINAHRTIPLAELWGTGTTSSSDGQRTGTISCGSPPPFAPAPSLHRPSCESSLPIPGRTAWRWRYAKLAASSGRFSPWIGLKTSISGDARTPVLTRVRHATRLLGRSSSTDWAKSATGASRVKSIVPLA